MPFAGLGLPPAGQPIAAATLTVGIHECSGAGKVGEGPKVCSTAGVSGSSQAASGRARAPMHIASSNLFRMLAPRLSQDNTKSRRVFIALAMKLIGHIHERRPRHRTPPLRPTRMEPG